ncbi:DUF6316 family protein [Aurantivibrio plasticivorans]
MSYRANEEGRSWFRTDRFFIINNEWYFNTRECENVGPFSSLKTAQQGAHRFLKTLSLENTTPQYAANIARSGEWAVTLYQ